MGGQFYHSGGSSEFQYEKRINTSRDSTMKNEMEKHLRGRDEDLIIEENTIYEIDRDCYERLKKQKKRK